MDGALPVRSFVAVAERVVTAPSELLPCPFCGLTEEGVKCVENISHGIFAVECEACDFDGPPETSGHAAIAAWNRPASVPLAVARQAREALDNAHAFGNHAANCAAHLDVADECNCGWRRAMSVAELAVAAIDAALAGRG